MNSAQKSRAELEGIITENKNTLEHKLLSLKQDQEQEAARAKANRQKLEFIQELFDAREASVYLQKQNVLIRAQGFYFPVGQSEIDSKNFLLLHKIAKAVSQYPNSTIFVTGHTDNTGQDRTNLNLSRDRATKVAKFLSEFGGIKTSRIRVSSHGESKPIESNDTPEGRAANRRVEILIRNT